MSGERECGPTHHLGCACHEARRDAEVAELRAELGRYENTPPTFAELYNQMDRADLAAAERDEALAEAGTLARERDEANLLARVALRAGFEECAKLREERNAAEARLGDAETLLKECVAWVDSLDLSDRIVDFLASRGGER